VNVCPTAEHGLAVEGLEFAEARTVHDPGDHLALIEGNTDVGGCIPKSSSGRRPALTERDRSVPCFLHSRCDDLAAEADRVDLVLREVVAHARDPAVHLGAAELLVVALLAGRHLHQRRSGQVDLRLLLHHHHVVAHPRDVGAARRRASKHETNRRNLRSAESGVSRTARNEYLS
jgi:hypothetical protein